MFIRVANGVWNLQVVLIVSKRLFLAPSFRASPSVCLCWHAHKQRKNVCTKSVRCQETLGMLTRRCGMIGASRCWLSGTTAHVKDAPLHLSAWKRECICVNIILVLLPQLFVSFRDHKHQRRPLVLFWRFSWNVRAADLLQTLLQSVNSTHFHEHPELLLLHFHLVHVCKNNTHKVAGKGT